MNRVLENITLASAPYLSALWKAISTGNIMEASPMALMAAAKEHHFQYQELVKDSVAATLYVAKTALFLDYLKKFRVCNMTELRKAHTELTELVKTLHSDKGIYDQLDTQQSHMNQILQDYNSSHDVNKYVRNMKTLSEKMFVKSWPGWYRAELNSHINRLNIMIDDAQVDILQGDTYACARKPRSPRMAVKPPVVLDQQDQDIFYDAVSSPRVKSKKPLKGGNVFKIKY